MNPEELFLRSFFKTLNDRKVVYAVARQWALLPESLGGSDLDIVAGSEKDLCDVLSISRKVAETCCGSTVSYYRVEGAAICLGGCVNGAWWGCHIDVFVGFKFHGFPYLDACPVIASRVLERSCFYRCSKYFETIAFFKELLANGNDKKGYYSGARREYVEDKQGVVAALLYAFGESCSKVLADMLGSEKSAVQLKRIGRLLYRRLMWEYICTHGLWAFLKLKSLNYWRRAARLINPPGFAVAFLGTDGSGKSTLIDNVTSPIERMLHSCVHYEHLRPNLLPYLSQLKGQKPTGTPCTDPHGGKVSGVCGSIVRFTYYFMDYVFGYWLKIYPILVKRSSMVIFDRYYYEYMIDPRRCAVRLPRGWAKFWSWFIPKPDLILCLGGDPVQIYSRKPETSLEEVGRQVRELRSFCDSNRRCVWIDTTIGLEESKDMALSAIVEAMSRRYR